MDRRTIGRWTIGKQACNLCTQASRSTTLVDIQEAGKQADRQAGRRAGSIDSHHIGVFMHVGVRMAAP